MTIGEKIYALRKQQNLSQEELSTILNVSRQAISKWETSESIPDVNNVVQLSEIFDVTTDFILKNGWHEPGATSEEAQPATTHTSNTTIRDFIAEGISRAHTERKTNSNIAFARGMFTAGGIGLVFSSISGMLWWRVSDMLFFYSIYLILLGFAGLVRKHIYNIPMPPIARLGSMIMKIAVIVVIVAGIQGFLDRDRADVVLALAWGAVFAGNAMLIVACARQYANGKKKRPDVIDLRLGASPPTPDESDVTPWKN